VNTIRLFLQKECQAVSDREHQSRKLKKGALIEQSAIGKYSVVCEIACDLMCFIGVLVRAKLGKWFEVPVGLFLAGVSNRLNERRL